MLFLQKVKLQKFICAIDERIYLWLKQCRSKESVTDTDIALVEFSTLLSDVQLNRFSYFLPPSITRLDTGDVANKKLKKRKEKDRAEMIKNTAQVEEWKLRASESWETVFKEKTVDGPILSFGCKPCLKFHVKGVCYDDCKNSESHKVLAGKDKEKTEDYIKSLRNE